MAKKSQRDKMIETLIKTQCPEITKIEWDDENDSMILLTGFDGIKAHTFVISKAKHLYEIVVHDVEE